MMNKLKKMSKGGENSGICWAHAYEIAKFLKKKGVNLKFEDMFNQKRNNSLRKTKEKLKEKSSKR